MNKMAKTTKNTRFKDFGYLIEGIDIITMCMIPIFNLYEPTGSLWPLVGWPYGKARRWTATDLFNLFMNIRNVS